MSNIFYILQWWFVFFLTGVIFLPLTSLVFKNFLDRGYIFSKTLGIAILSYLIYILGILKVFKFTQIEIVLMLWPLLLFNLFVLIKVQPSIRLNLLKSWKIILFEEFLFFAALLSWAYVRAHEPSIRGLEKFMDFGFVNSILRSEYFPPADMWFPPFPINYYYFGHLVTALLTKLSSIPSYITYNLMLATIFALTFTSAFSIGANLIYILKSKRGVTQKEGDLNERDAHMFDRTRAEARVREFGSASEGKSPTIKTVIFAGLLTAFLVTFAGNLQTIYPFFKPYPAENPLPFWQLPFSPFTFPNNYWYANATRFIPFTIHEFPSYSFVVADLHGHVLDIPFVLLTIALIFVLFLKKPPAKSYPLIALLAFLLAIMYMTNAWDGIIYFLLATLVLLYLLKSKISSWIYYLVIVGILGFIFSLPFSLHFKPFVSGIGVICMPEFLTKVGHLGPFLFEADHCQRSSLYQLAILYGFFYFWVISFIAILLKIKYQKSNIKNTGRKLNSFKNLGFIENLKLKTGNLTISDIFVLLLITLSTILIIIPEFFYVKDIYPAHYRANTMFKLVYQAFIMLSIASGFIIVRLVRNWKLEIGNWKFPILIGVGIIGLILVGIYPYFSVNSYYGELKDYKGLDGIVYLKNLYPEDYEAIIWINKNIKGQPVLLEAQGDSYTDYERISTNTGLPTVLGWTVHEWLWRKTYDVPAPRIEEVRKIYESESIQETNQLLNKYNVSYAYIGTLERQKYPNLFEGKFKQLGNVIFQIGETRLYKIH